MQVVIYSSHSIVCRGLCLRSATGLGVDDFQFIRQANDRCFVRTADLSL